jgi:hypothetical protein
MHVYVYIIYVTNATAFSISSELIQSVHCAGLLDVQDMLSADTGISGQTEGYSFGDHLISESVSVTP